MFQVARGLEVTNGTSQRKMRISELPWWASNHGIYGNAGAEVLALKLKRTVMTMQAT